ncbi:dihydroorotase [Nitrosomonas sp. PY1]|uniref:dihydroorotase n=1 Tax=Nitrosomonas sp. PY1 TaxID=1803906 RepID=UPI001FC879EA|nr:dihydroorotase [Nitrosomonas sp. PY1]GKS69132.1 dihydroorotase [Nitrosomonas sp. PY1]
MSSFLTHLKIIRPDDWHLHLRDGEQLKDVLLYTARQFARAVIMPNLRVPVVTTEMAQAYYTRIISALPEVLQSQFQPLMTLYLTDNTQPSEIVRAKNSGIVQAVKLYPAGATTHSDAGVTNISKCFKTLAEMEKQDIPLLVHGEVTDPNIDVFDREKMFIERTLCMLTQHFPQLRIVFEHITTRDAVEFVKQSSEKIAATITAHHLLLNRNALFQGGIRPHHYCLPILKRETHRRALLQAAVSGNAKFFLGTDSAPHALVNKEQSCGCAGIFTAHAAMELYATAFEQVDALDKLEGFASFFGADFYELPRNTDTITLRRKNWMVPERYDFAGEALIPLYADAELSWKVE